MTFIPYGILTILKCECNLIDFSQTICCLKVDRNHILLTKIDSINNISSALESSY